MINLFVWEIKKNIKRGAVIGVSVAALAMLILLAIVYNMLNDFVKQIRTDVNGGLAEEMNQEGISDEYINEQLQSLSNKTVFESEEEVDELLNQARQNLEEETGGGGKIDD